MIIAILLVVGLIGALGYVYYQNFIQKKDDDTSKTKSPISTLVAIIDPLADWKTYSDSSYGFSFRYPSDWTLTKKDAAQYSTGSITLTSPQRTPNQYGYTPSDMSIYPEAKTSPVGSSGSTIIAMWRTQQDSLKANTEVKQYSETIHSIPFTEYDIGGDLPVFQALFTTKNYIVAVGFASDIVKTKSDLTKSDSAKTMSEILSSFHLT